MPTSKGDQNHAFDMDFWSKPGFNREVIFIRLSDGPSLQNHGYCSRAFAPGSTVLSHSQAAFAICTISTISTVYRNFGNSRLHFGRRRRVKLPNTLSGTRLQWAGWTKQTRLVFQRVTRELPLRIAIHTFSLHISTQAGYRSK